MWLTLHKAEAVRAIPDPYFCPISATASRNRDVEQQQVPALTSENQGTSIRASISGLKHGVVQDAKRELRCNAHTQGVQDLRVAGETLERENLRR